ncbi:NAD-dependent epimerase [Nitrosospira multiformis]|uniref:UDP-glucuronate 4-epimerase n=1 Tax=Nitrosospira multiformis TaxID=1231 RepID=A0A1I7GCT8_9PROT|nr:NAD-dependent epimerase [Nitrosospira multiformis]SFU46243.1 UDP-glucuronate 4-epimerase [Nitrosospira multiformis]
MKVLITGAAGFIGMHVARRLLEQGREVVGIDNLNSYYDVRLKENRLKQLFRLPRFRFVKLDISDRSAMENLFAAEGFQRVVNLAAQAGVRYSLKDPHAYISSNIIGFLNVLEGCRHEGIEHLVYASSSSVYGLNTSMPFGIHDNVDHPVSLYAATKKSNELMAHTYSHLYGLPTTGLRFFTVYGPWGRPDMSPYLFTESILKDRPIEVFNNGRMKRDFTYIDDVVDGVARILDKIPEPDANFQCMNPDPASSQAPYRIYNIGNHNPIELMTFIETIEKAVGKRAVKNLLPMQPGDVEETYAEIEELRQIVGFEPHMPLDKGINEFVNWYKSYNSLA